MNLVRDALWMWGHEPGTHDHQYGLPATSRMTAAEAAHYLGVPNVVMSGIGNSPQPPFDQHMMAFQSLKRVVWSVVGDSSSTRIDLDEVLRLAAIYPNLVGAMMDDFFHGGQESEQCGRLGPGKLQEMRDRLRDRTPPLDLWVTLYAHDLDSPVERHLHQCDVVTFWTWTADQLINLEANFAQLKARAPETRVVLGCYMWDYGASKPMPLEDMKHQCRLGLQWLEEGRVEGLVFLSNSACDLGLDTVEWTRDWIAEVGDRELPPPGVEAIPAGRPGRLPGVAVDDRSGGAGMALR